MNWFVEDWHKAWKWLQVQLGALIIIAPELYNGFEGLQSYIPVATFRHCMAVLGVLVIINSVRRKT